MTVCHATSPSIILTAPTVCLSTRKAVALSVRPTHSPSVIPPVCHPSSLSTLPSLCPRLVSPPPLLSVLRNVHQTIPHCPTVCTPSYHVRQAVLHHLAIHPPSTPVCQPICHRPTICTTHQSVCQPVVRPYIRHPPRFTVPKIQFTP